MNYAKIRTHDIANGEGVRTSLFVSGCTLHCPGCFNTEAQDFSFGTPFTEQTIKEIEETLKDPVVTGLSILGGEPLDQDNDGLLAMIELCDITHRLGKNVWMWTGHVWEDVFEKPCELGESRHKALTEDARYYICNSKYVSASCDGVGSIPAREIEDIVFDEMSRKLVEFASLSHREKSGDSMELAKCKVRADQIDKEINELIDKLVLAGAATAEYVNNRIEALDEEKKNVKEKIAQLSASLFGKQDIETITDYMSKWDDISIQDKISVVDALIETIHVGHGKVQIKWKI